MTDAQKPHPLQVVSDFGQEQDDEYMQVASLSQAQARVAKLEAALRLALYYLVDCSGHVGNEYHPNWRRDRPEHIEAIEAAHAALAGQADPAPRLRDESHFEVAEEGEVFAWCHGPREEALREARHYAAPCVGDFEIFEVMRTLIETRVRGET